MSKHVDLSEDYDAIVALHRAGDHMEAEDLICKLAKKHPTIFDNDNLHFAKAMEDRGATRFWDDRLTEPKWSYRFPS